MKDKAMIEALRFLAQERKDGPRVIQISRAAYDDLKRMQDPSVGMIEAQKTYGGVRYEVVE